MSKLSESYVVEYLNRRGFATVQGVKKGAREWDILAIRIKAPARALHVEVQVSYDPISYLSSSNARLRTEEVLQADLLKWIHRKFERKEIRKIRKQFFEGEWERWLVHGTLADPRELELLAKEEISLLSFADVLADLCKSHPRDLDFTAEGKDLVEVVRNLLPVAAAAPPSTLVP